MRLSVVITALNDETTLLESIESLFSQRILPAQTGLVLGPSRDDTDEFAGFYHDDFDFVSGCLQIDPTRRGRSELRLASLREVDTDYVLFLPGNSYLYRDAVDRLERVLEERPDYLVQPVRYYTDGTGSYTSRIPEPPYGEGLLRTGPHHPAGFVWRVEDLRRDPSRLSALRAGPFSSLAWYCELYGNRESPGVAVLEEPVAEAVDYREGPSCWDRSVFRALAEIISRYRETLPGLEDVIRTWLNRGLKGLAPGLVDSLRDSFDLPGTPEPEKSPGRMPPFAE